VVVHQRGPLPAACVRLEGDQIGALPTSFVAGGQPVVIDEWAARDATGKELVGFAADLPGDVVYVVHAGDQTFVDMRARWLHPAGVVGPRSQAIDALTFCHVPARVDGCPAPLELD
jgi:hypothetical protein